ncbi:TcpQ domain-containing protein [Ralstonia sp. OTU4908]|jgi:Toxin co-regulated pilus biosynthesis protein Q|uniref:TcpQ domain-containing protein n=1 Tax=Ralstonia sp. OTU4908 TaxID=3043851 RepID=UPI00313D30FE
MRKLLVVLALVPALSQAALVIEGGPRPPAATPPAQNVASTAAPAAAEPAQATGLVIAPLWAATPTDETFQKLFVRWGRQAGWKTFWEVGQDIPVVASSNFTGAFTDAVQDVLDTTLSTDLPAHPCFYTNNVLRVLPTSTECDPK